MKLRSPKGFLSIAIGFILLASAALLLIAQAHKADGQLGYTDTPIIPGQKWHVHDSGRPHPRVVTPSSVPGGPPSDAIVLFDGKDLSKWENQKGGQSSPAAWKVENGYIECVGGTGDLVTKEKFGDIQLHVEWASPVQIEGSSQARGNSGILLMHRYELQVLDSSNNPTYADGQAGAIYGWWPPLVNAAKKPGEWQTYDVVFDAPKFEGDKLSQPAYLTVFHNGIVLHNKQQIGGPMAHRAVHPYVAHGAEEPLAFQDHGTKVRFRNIWVRRLMPYDQQ